jgi:hypothetical protein
MIKRPKKGDRLGIIQSRLEQNVIPEPMSGCHLWLGACNPSRGYGVIRVGGRQGRTLTVHRLAYQIYVGEIPEGKQVLHRCDVRSCVNPQHLFLGDNAINVADKVAKKRHRWGERMPMAKLKEYQVLQILDDHRFYREIAEDYGVDRRTIGDIKAHKRWKYLHAEAA